MTPMRIPPPCLVGAGEGEDLADVGPRVVVVVDRAAQITATAGAVGAQHARGRGDRVAGVVDVAAAAVVVPGRGRAVADVELHRPGAAAEGVDAGAHAGRARAAVVGLHLTDAREYAPGQPRARPGRGPVERQVVGGDLRAGRPARRGSGAPTSWRRLAGVQVDDAGLAEHVHG